VIDVRVVSIGCMSAHPLWGERTPLRTGHSTTTLVRAGGSTIIVDPGLPESVLHARLGERAGISADQVTHVFLTSFHPETHRGIGAFAEAKWLIAREEREGQGVPLVQMLKRAMDAAGRGADDDQGESVVAALRREVAVLQRCEEAPERLERGVDLFPLWGVTPGMSGLLIETPDGTTLICGDAVATREHALRGMVVSPSVDVARARESLAEALQIADVLVCGRDNMVVNSGVPRGPGDEGGVGGEGVE
jgi:glyoxylase-like metal-dependent hydrolase (beta-lactamase superfamily II)